MRFPILASIGDTGRRGGRRAPASSHCHYEATSHSKCSASRGRYHHMPTDNFTRSITSNHMLHFGLLYVRYMTSPRNTFANFHRHDALTKRSQTVIWRRYARCFKKFTICIEQTEQDRVWNPGVIRVISNSRLSLEEKDMNSYEGYFLLFSSICNSEMFFILPILYRMSHLKCIVP